MSQTMEGAKTKNTGLGEVSFSSYLSTAEEIFEHKLEEPAIQNPRPVIAPSVGIHAPARLERNKIEEGEIGVFGAEKYFNMKLADDDDEPSLKIENQVDLHRMMTPRRWPGTPSASSKTSWNSPAVLLRSFMRNRSKNKQKKIDGKSFFSNLSCTWSCSDGKSVHVSQNVDHGRIHGKEYRKEHIQINHRANNIDRRKLSEGKFKVKDGFDNQSFDQMSVGSNREVYHRPPVLKPGLQDVTVKTQFDDPRNSLEVFGSTAMKGDIAKNLERNLSMLTWDAIPIAPTISSISKSSQLGDDIESDASSDLFEIDNISGSGQGLFTRQASDGMSSCITPYAPSETSIEWNVVTASAADCSFVSDYDEKRSAAHIQAPGSKTASRVTDAKVLLDKVAQRSRSGGILGCKTHKAVMVAETAYRSDEQVKAYSVAPGSKICYRHASKTLAS